MSNLKAISNCVDFRSEGHNFTQHTQFPVTERLSETENVSKVILKLRLKQKENFWILKAATLTSKCLN